MHVYMGREIAPILLCNIENLITLTRYERWLQEQPQLILDALSIQPGMKIADIGAGSGFLTIELAHRVGSQGSVFATDLQSQMLDFLLHRPDLPNNVIPILSTSKHTGLPSKTFDLILLVDVYHEAPRPDILLKDLRRALKSHGRLVLVEYREEDPRMTSDPRHRMSARQVVMELEANRFRLVEQFEHLPWQHLLIFKKR
ncbi:unnamed protein product [Rotaria sordida]|uniref:Methyltransferase type 11 domain-containing protein n=1 Tax=Rotaria sordida TaxID=392033 RepID=A0A815AGB6_9BILA|nr:unnamed protein product [Rotaria sordida]CAF1259111.1 unnamed protein product [Rotaria sordida]